MTRIRRTVSLAPAPAGISVVVPVYNSEATVHRLVSQIADALPGAHEVILVDDGSSDGSWAAIEREAAERSNVTGIRLMRNFGQHPATLQGVLAAAMPVIVTIDDDLQHDPADIPALVARLDEGYDVVYGLAADPQHSPGRRLASAGLKLAMRHAMGVKGVEETSPFRAFRTEVRQAFEHHSGPYVSIDVLLSWGTTRFTSLAVEHRSREVGRSNYTFTKLVQHATNMVTGFTAWPLRLASGVGFATTLLGLAVLVYVLGRYALSGGQSVPGFPFLASAIAIFAGVQLFALGIMGEYLARLHFRSMGRPHSVVRTVAGRGTGRTPD